MDFEKKKTKRFINVWFFGCWIIHHSGLCDSAKNLISAKTGSHVVGENVFDQSVCKIFLIFNLLKTKWKPISHVCHDKY